MGGMLWWLLLLVSGVQAAHPSDMNKYSCVSQFIPSSPSDRLKEKEHCSVCEAIVENARKWDFDTHLGGLCAGVAEHAMDWCIHYACRLRYECAYFYSKSCSVLSESGTGIVKSNNEKNLVSLGPDGNKISPSRSYANLSPCPAKYVCSYCLGIPRQQVYGCFDTYNVVTRNPWARDGYVVKSPTEMSKEAIDPTPRLEKALAAPEKAPAVPEKPPDKPEKAPDKPEKPPAKPEKGPDKPAPAPLTPPVINDGFIYLRLHMPGKQSLYFAETPKSDGTTTHPYALLSSDKSKRAPVQLIHTDLDATSDQELKDKDTVDLRCMKTKDKKDYDRLYGSSGGWAKYTTHDDPNQAKLTWTIERANSGGVLRDGDIVKLRDNHYTHHICGNLDKTWEEEKGYYIKVMSEDKDSKLNGSCSWIVEVVKDYLHTTLYPHL